jgi:O-glycosyl hydrolase
VGSDHKRAIGAGGLPCGQGCSRRDAHRASSVLTRWLTGARATGRHERPRRFRHVGPGVLLSIALTVSTAGIVVATNQAGAAVVPPGAPSNFTISPSSTDCATTICSISFNATDNSGQEQATIAYVVHQTATGWSYDAAQQPVSGASPVGSTLNGIITVQNPSGTAVPQSTTYCMSLFAFVSPDLLGPSNTQCVLVQWPSTNLSATIQAVAPASIDWLPIVAAHCINGADCSSGATSSSSPPGASFQVTYKGKSFSTSLPPSSIATYTWTPGSDTVSVTETGTSGGSLVKNVELARQPSLSFGTASGSLPTVTVDPSVSMQKIAGFGGAMTQSSASLINNSTSENKIMGALFGPTGADFNIIRVPMGASDFVTGPIYQDDTSFSYDDNDGKADTALANFSIGSQSAAGAKAKVCAHAAFPGEYGAGDYSDTIPALLCAKSFNQSLNLLAVPWSAPGWMKIDDSTVPGRCAGRDDFLRNSDYGTYASYFVKFLEAYRLAGLTVSEISMQNEPENCKTTYPTMEMKPSDQATFAMDLYSKLHKSSGSLSAIPTIMAYDHNYLDNPNPPWNAPADQVTGYPEAVISQSGGTSTRVGPVGLVGFHDYTPRLDQEEQAFDKEHDANPKVPIWMTEATGTYGTSTQAQNLVWEGQHDLMEPLQNWVSASLYLNLVLNSSGGPHDGGCGDCRGMVTLNPDGTYSLNEDYYDWAQFSKFIQPGATHICADVIDLSTVSTGSVHRCTSTSSAWIPTNSDDLIDTVAFSNPNGSIVLVAMNTTRDNLPA